VSAIFQRPLCEMGKAYDFAFRPTLGDPELGSGGPCDDRPHPVELFGSGADPAAPAAPRRAFSLCPEHESQLRHHDALLNARGAASRFVVAAPTGVAPGGRR
jgi:hypothetical protein